MQQTEDQNQTRGFFVRGSAPPHKRNLLQNNPIHAQKTYQHTKSEHLLACLLCVDRALLCVEGSLLCVEGSLLCVDRALLCVDRALLCVEGSLL